MKTTLVMMRHGESEWNRLNLFQGWADIPLSAQGIEESLAAGKMIAHIPFEVIFVSGLIRTQMSALLAMTKHASGKVPIINHPGDESKIYSQVALQNCIPVIKAWQLNERMYGELQGKNKAETVKQFGPEQVKIWRRSYDVAPPQGESLATTTERVLPYFNHVIVPYLTEGKNVLIVAHGNSIRAIVKYIENLSDEEIIHIEIATGTPTSYSYDHGTWIPLT